MCTLGRLWKPMVYILAENMVVLSQIGPLHLLDTWMTSHKQYDVLLFFILFTLESVAIVDAHWMEFFPFMKLLKGYMDWKIMLSEPPMTK